MPTRIRLPNRRLLAMAVAVAAAGPMAHAQDAPAAQSDSGRSAASAACPLGSFQCPKRPVSYALCRPNALLSFYQPGLPADANGRKQALTDVLAEQVDSADRSVYHMDGNVRLQRYDQLLRADRLDYNDTSTAYDAHGDVRYQDSTLLLSADRIQGTTTPDKADADDVRYQLLQGRGNGVAEQASLLDPQHSRYRQATYSTCDPDNRVWEFRARQITLDKDTGVGVARGATMRFHDVPFLYLPYMSFPIDDRRKSGFLYPSFGNSSNAGFMVQVPYYLNLAPNYDATLLPRIYGERGVMLGGEVRYLTRSSRGQLQFDYLPNDSGAGSDSAGRPRNLADGADRFLIDWRHSTRLGSGWSFSGTYRRVSDKYYFEDFSSDLATASTRTLSSNAYLTGSGSWWNAAIGVNSYQSVDPELPDRGLQYKRWPRGVFDMDVPLARNLDIGMKSEAVAFRKDDAIEGNRVDLYPYVAAPLGGSYWFLRPELAYRYTRYDLIGDTAHYGYKDREPSRSLPIASIDSGLIFERSAQVFGSHYTQTLEPRLYYLYVPYRDQGDLPLFDTRETTFDFWQLFSSNRFSGADRQMNANNLTAALTSRLLDDGGVERASVSFGQIRYFTPQRVQLRRNAPETDYSGSAYVGQFAWQLSDNWRLNTAYQWNPNVRRTDVGTLGLQRRLGGDGVFNFAYRFRRNFMEQFDVSAVIPVSERWRLLGRWNYSLRDYENWQRGNPKTLEAVAGVEYDSCCVAVRLIGRHYVRNYEGDTANAVMLEIEFKGLGAFAPQTEDFLHRAILGYQ